MDIQHYFFFEFTIRCSFYPVTSATQADQRDKGIPSGIKQAAAAPFENA
jgi:hypothetical protein